jgi:hypothetical protein
MPRATQGIFGRPRELPDLSRADSYLTDGERLFRVVMPYTPVGRGAHVRLEDCLTLEIRSYTPAELYGMNLRFARSET